MLFFAPEKLQIQSASEGRETNKKYFKTTFLQPKESKTFPIK